MNRRRRLHLTQLRIALALTLALGMLSSTQALAQSADTTSAEAVNRSVVRKSPVDSLALRRLPSPGGAFLRSVLVPGWGQAAYGAYFRGGVYFAAEAGSWFMLLKTIAKLGEAKDIKNWRVGMVRDSAMAVITADPEEWAKYENDPLALEAYLGRTVDQHPNVRSARKLVDARKEQREDWIVLTLFWALASGVDAYVNAHLSDFPARIEADALSDGRFELGVRLPVGGGK